MKKIKKQKNSGVSLLETLIYSAILTIMAITVTQSVLTMTQAYGNIKLHRLMNISVSDAMEKMAREIRSAYDIDDAGSIFNSPQGKIKINVVDEFDVATTREFFMSGAGIFVKEGVSSPEPITSSSTEITSLIFNKITASTTSKAIKINLTAKVKVGKLEKTENFYGTAVLRGSY